MKKILVLCLLVLGFSFPVYVIKAEEYVSWSYEGRTTVWEFNAVENGNSDYILIDTELENDVYSIDITGITYTVPRVSNMDFKDLASNNSDYSRVVLKDRAGGVGGQPGIIAQARLTDFIGSDVNIFETSFDLVIPFSKFAGLTASEIQEIYLIQIYLYTSSDLTTVPTFEYDFAFASTGLFTYYQGNFEGEEFIVYWYGESGSLYKINNYYSRTFESIDYTPYDYENYRFYGWKTYTGRTYGFNGIILDDEIITINGDSVFPLYPIIAGGSLVEPTETTTQIGVITEILAIFNLNNEWGFMVLYLMITVIGILVFLFKKWAFMGLIWPHLILTILFWILGFIKIYIIIPMFVLYVIVFIMKMKAKGEVENG